MGGHTPTQTILALAGEVALLLWSVQLVAQAVSNAAGSRLRSFLAQGLTSRWRAFAVGLVVTAGLQSSTATAMMVASFAGSGLVALTPALAMMLGANVGTTLIVQFVIFDTSMAIPLLLIAGYALSKRALLLSLREVGRAIFGLGLMLLSLSLMQATMQPVEHSLVLRNILGSLSQDPIVALLLAAVLSWAAHSSVAAILIVMSLAGAGVIGTATMLAMVLGCNLGTAMNPLVQSLSASTQARRVPVGNLLNRLVGCVAGLALLPALVALLERSSLGAAQTVAAFHFIFNLVLALIFLVPLPAISRLLIKLLPKAADALDPAKSRYLDKSALDRPAIALANATREVLRMADVVDEMLAVSQQAFATDDLSKVTQISRADDVLDSLFNQIQLYVGAIRHEQISEVDEERLGTLLDLAINLEHIGDIIEKNLMQMAAKRIRDRRMLPAEGLARFAAMHTRLRDHLRLALNVFLSQDESTAKRIVREKEMFRDLEREAIERQLVEMRTGSAEAVILSALQLDITRDLKRIDSHIAATVHGLLERRGVLKGSRLLSVAE